MTSFFRDDGAFETLTKTALPQLFAGETAEPIRVWVSGCATGEEAYTVAMLLTEEASRHELRPPIQVFGSDLDVRALNIAREGRYPTAIEADLSEERLRRFFVREGDSYRVRQDLRDMVLFAVHDLLKDPPFSRVDLISCRNLMIYLDRELQEQVCSTFHYALNPGGFLLLGASETADNPPGLFRTVDRNARLYRAARHETVRRLTQELELTQTRLRTVREESDAANEELRAANEELQSINEEYRSTSEELETSKEELQSINEELQTVNSELKIKLEAISRAHSDLQNLMAATDIGVLFLDSNLRIKRFTERVVELFSITPADEGRPITDFTHQFDYDDLIKDVRAVLADLAPLRREVQSRNGPWYDMRVRPYRTLNDKIDGVVITFVDISERRQVEEALRKSEGTMRMLLNELKHRVKNILTVVQAVASQTARETGDGGDFLPLFRGRLAALASAHDLLVQSEWKGADLESLVRNQLNPYDSTRGDRLRISGESVLLPAGIATPFGLVLHELAVNATKHGALSVPEGQVDVSWTLEQPDGMRCLTLLWRERNGPRSAAVNKLGSGSALIEHALPDSKIKRDFQPSGLVCSIELPLPATDDQV